MDTTVVMTADSHRKTNSIEGLQYLRGIAALMVVFFHSRSYFSEVPQWSHIGARGVDIFFVLSGFIMAYTTRHVEHGVPAIKASLEFLSNRFIRIVPLYWIALLWTSRAYWMNWLSISNSPAELLSNLSPEMISIFKDFAFIPHFSIDEDEQGEVFPILIQGWTLNYEMFFYVLFGVALLFGKYRLISASLVLYALYALGKIFTFHDLTTLFYTSPSLIQFVFGMVVYEIYLKTQHMSFTRSALLVACVFGFMLLFSGSKVNDKLVMGVAAAIIVWVFIHAFRDIHNVALKVLGDASYSIYLFHAAAFEGVRYVIKHLALDSSGFFNSLLIVMSQVAAGVAVGIIIYYAIEKPILKMLRGVSRRVFSTASKTQIESEGRTERADVERPTKPAASL